MKPEKFDFGGYVTKTDVLCSDGRTIKRDAFKHQNGSIVPLTWQHGVNDPANILGHVVLEHRDDGVYGYATFNDSANAANARGLVENKAVNALSIYANKLNQVGKDVMHGIIREVSLVLSGANPGALIDTLSFAHGEFDEDEIDEAIIYSGDTLSLSHSEEEKKEVKHEDDEEDGDETVGDVLDTLTDKQKAAVGYLLEQISGEDDTDAEHSEEENDNMKENVFDNDKVEEGQSLTHADFEAIMTEAKKSGSFRNAFLAHIESIDMELDDALAHAGTYGLDNIGYLFPDAQKISNTPDWIKRETGWVAGWMNGTRHTPFSRIKSLAADITPDEARAKGYVTGAEKTDEVFELLTRTTTPVTVYKKQKLDRDDIVDITDFDVVAWLKAEMRMMLEEEIARASLVSDGRLVADPDKIPEANVRPIYNDAAMYAHPVTLAGADASEYIDEILGAMANYKGSGSPNFYGTNATIISMLLIRDTIGRRLYPTRSELAAALGVANIVEVEVMEGVQDDPDTPTANLFGIIVNPTDYTFGADRGGSLASFDDFDIDYNQYKYLIETRLSGCLTKPKSALVIWEPIA